MGGLSEANIVFPQIGPIRIIFHLVPGFCDLV